jgi:plastocyanin
MQSLIKLLALAATVSCATVTIDVGEDGSLKFEPDSSTAAVGDTLQFHFYSGSGPHSVVHGDFANPCLPSPNAFFSGYLDGSDDGSTVFEVTVTNTDPIVRPSHSESRCFLSANGIINSGSTVQKRGIAKAAWLASSTRPRTQPLPTSPTPRIQPR